MFFLYPIGGERGGRTKTICTCGLNLANFSRQKGKELLEIFGGLKLLELFVFGWAVLSTLNFRRRAL